MVTLDRGLPGKVTIIINTKKIQTTRSLKYKESKGRQSHQASMLDEDNIWHRNWWMCDNVVTTAQTSTEDRIENSNSTCANAPTNLSKKVLIFYRKAPKKLSKALAEVVSELMQDWTETTTKLQEQTQPRWTPPDERGLVSQEGDQPTIYSFVPHHDKTTS